MTNPRILFALLIAVFTRASLPARAAEHLVTVNGEASVSVAPDLVMIRIGVTSQAKNARAASEANAKEMTKVLTAIEQNGIAKKDIRTSRLSLQPQYDASKPGAARLTGFRVTNQVTIKIRDIGQLPSILDRAIASGANEMSGIEFVVSQRSTLLDRARGEAIADAHRKAELYANAAGAKLGRVIAITEGGTSTPPRPVMQALRAGGVPVAPGERTLRASVTVSYELTH